MILFPGTELLLIYIAAAVLPAVALLVYIYRRDTVEKEPWGLLVSLLICGVLAVFLSIVLEMAGVKILGFALESGSKYYTIIFAFLVVGVVEEGTKMYFLKRRTWNDSSFSHLFDGIVYSAFVSMGFAAFENVKYVFAYGLSVAIPRALFAIPGHLGFSIFMGVFYGRAKLWENRGNQQMKKTNLILAYLSAVFLHGFYDSCAMIGTSLANILFYAFVIAMYIVVYIMIRRESLGDKPL